jgi:hypothetical protein
LSFPLKQESKVSDRLAECPLSRGMTGEGVSSIESPPGAYRQERSARGLAEDFWVEQPMLQKRRNEKAVKSLKTNDPAKSLIRRI